MDETQKEDGKRVVVTLRIEPEDVDLKAKFFQIKKDLGVKNNAEVLRNLVTSAAGKLIAKT